MLPVSPAAGVLEPPSYHEPAPLHEGNRVFGAGDPAIKAQGINELRLEDFVTTALPSDGDTIAAGVAWAEVAPRQGTARGRKRKRDRAPRLALEVANPGPLPLGVSLSLSGAAQPESLRNGRIESGILYRPSPEDDATPNLPASLGKSVCFVTVAASVPPFSAARLCLCRGDADRLAGFVYLLSPEVAHPNPTAWRGVSLRLPLTGPPGSAWLCTQGFGGAGHHRGATMHHSVDFECDEGTALVAVGDGVILEVSDRRRLGAGHVDLLPEANLIKLQLDKGGYVAVYLHLRQGSAIVKAGDRVCAGQHIAASGNVGFTTGPHLHFQLNIGVEPESHTVMFGFEDDTHGVAVPVAGYSYSTGGVLPHKPGGWQDALGQLTGLLVGKIGQQAPITRAEATSVLERALLWLNVEPFTANASVSLQEESDEDALKPYPSEHTCLVRAPEWRDVLKHVHRCATCSPSSLC